MATSSVAGKVLSEYLWLEISCPMAEMIGCYCGAAAVLVEAVALSYFFMKMRMQAAAACAAALEGVHMSEFLCALAAFAFVELPQESPCWLVDSGPNRHQQLLTSSIISTDVQ